jgi:hypothetical protein
MINGAMGQWRNGAMAKKIEEVRLSGLPLSHSSFEPLRR